MSPTEAKAISAAFGGEFLAPVAALGRLATIARGQGVRAGASKRGDAQCVSVTATGIRTETACVSPVRRREDHRARPAVHDPDRERRGLPPPADARGGVGCGQKVT